MGANGPITNNVNTEETKPRLTARYSSHSPSTTPSTNTMLPSNQTLKYTVSLNATKPQSEKTTPEQTTPTQTTPTQTTPTQTTPTQTTPTQTTPTQTTPTQTTLTQTTPTQTTPTQTTQTPEQTTPKQATPTTPVQSSTPTSSGTSDIDMRINFEEIAQHKTSIDNAASSLDTLWRAILAQINAISSSWVGPDASTFIEKINKMAPKVGAATQALKMISSTYQTAIDNIQENQEKIKNQIL